MRDPRLDVATASAVANVVGRLVGAPTSRVVGQLVRGERPSSDEVAPERMDELVTALATKDYLAGDTEALADATAALARACDLHAVIGRRMLHRGLMITHGGRRLFLRTGSTTALVEETGRANTPERHELPLVTPWRPWEALDAADQLLGLDLPQWRDDTSRDRRDRLNEVAADATAIASAPATFFSDESHAMVVQLGDLVGRLAAIAGELAAVTDPASPPPDA